MIFEQQSCQQRPRGTIRSLYVFVTCSRSVLYSIGLWDPEVLPPQCHPCYDVCFAFQQRQAAVGQHHEDSMVRNVTVSYRV